MHPTPFVVEVACCMLFTLWREETKLPVPNVVRADQLQVAVANLQGFPVLSAHALIVQVILVNVTEAKSLYPHISRPVHTSYHFQELLLGASELTIRAKRITSYGQLFGRMAVRGFFAFEPQDLLADLVVGFSLVIFVGKKSPEKSSSKLLANSSKSYIPQNPRHISAD